VGSFFVSGADRTPYIGQQLEQLGNHDHIPRVEPEMDEKYSEDEIRPARIQKCKYMDLSEISLMDQVDITLFNPRHAQRAQEGFPWDSYGTRHLYASLSDIDEAGRGAFMHHQIDAEAFLGWYLDSPSGYPDSDDDDSNTITAYRYHDDDARVYRDAWDPVNLRLTCLVALVNDPLDPRLWNAEIRTVGNKVGMYTIRPIAMDGEVYAAYGTEYFMDLRFPLALRLRAR
jgi:hypothetical protein